MDAGRMTADQVAEKKFTTAYFPVAVFAQHGPHLPLTTNILLARALAEAVGTRLDAFMLPVQPFGTCLEQDDGYSAGIGPELLYDMVLDLVRELSRQGFERLVLHQGYFGLDMLYPLTRHLNAAEGIRTVLLNPFELLAAQGGTPEWADDRHAGEIQTSLMLHLHPEAVRTGEMRGIDYLPQVPPARLDLKSMGACCPGGVWGRPSLASAEKGEKLFEQAVELSLGYVQEVFAFMEENGDYSGGRRGGLPNH